MVVTMECMSGCGRRSVGFWCGAKHCVRCGAALCAAQRRRSLGGNALHLAFCTSCEDRSMSYAEKIAFGFPVGLVAVRRPDQVVVYVDPFCPIWLGGQRRHTHVQAARGLFGRVYEGPSFDAHVMTTDEEELDRRVRIARWEEHAGDRWWAAPSPQRESASCAA
jgi:hypothetical protein